jgi:hypothetical protein
MMTVFAFGQPDYCASMPQAGGCEPVSWQTMTVGIIGWAAIFLLIILFFAFCWKCQTRQIERWKGGTDYRTAAYKQEFERQKRVVYKQRGRRCAICGSTDRVEMHHITPRAKGGQNNISNLLPLCHRHHQAMHGRRFG